LRDLFLELGDAAGILALRLVDLDPGLGLVAGGRGLELDVAFGQAPHQAGPIGGVLGRRLEEALEALNLGHEELPGAPFEAGAPLVTLRDLLRRRGERRLGLIVSFLQVDGLRRAVEADRRLLAGGRLYLAARTLGQRVLRLL